MSGGSPEGRGKRSQLSESPEQLTGDSEGTASELFTVQVAASSVNIEDRSVSSTCTFAGKQLCLNTVPLIRFF